MAYDPELADRIRNCLAAEAGLTERKMFGGLGFMVDGNMAAAAGSGGALMLRVDPDRSESYLGEGVDRFVMNGRRLAGWLLVEPQVIEGDAALAEWLAVGVAFARTLPAK